MSETASPGGVEALIVRYRRSLRAFIADAWGLEPQPPKPEYATRWAAVCAATGEDWTRLSKSVTAEWFGDRIEDGVLEGVDAWRWHDFRKGAHYTWQQHLVILAIEKGNRGDALDQIAVSSGHGIGKSATLSWVVLWYLLAHLNAQVPCTAPTATQMHDVLWKELSLWHGRMPAFLRDCYEIQAGYCRVVYNPAAWFARARTSTKENTEALAGIHADDVAILVDEASGVPDQVFNTAEGAGTSGKVLTVLISNPTRTEGYFYDAHARYADLWQTFSFNGEESPMVDVAYVEKMARRHGVGSEEYGIRVKGTFPKTGAMDDGGYVPLCDPARVTVLLDGPHFDRGGESFVGRRVLGVDPSGDGDDDAEFWVRDQFKAKSVLTLTSATESSIAEAILTLCEMYGVAYDDVAIDGFGCGAAVGQRVAVLTAGQGDPYTVLTGNPPEYEEKHGNIRLEDRERDPAGLKPLCLNVRALLAFRAWRWMAGGGCLIDKSTVDSPAKREACVIKYKRGAQGGRIQLMPKHQMKKNGLASPNRFDALSLTFAFDLSKPSRSAERAAWQLAAGSRDEEPFDRHSAI